MKKISSFLPKHVINKQDLLTHINTQLNHILEDKLKTKVTITSIKDNILIVFCEDSSVATLMRFEKHRYLKLLNQNSRIKILDMKICI
ncbi:MAG: hypothetical protein CMD82_00600 [Gammaproteobacteria bacterium]|nr:hypothetical protein [Gammaproteobacteria bacterium]